MIPRQVKRDAGLAARFRCLPDVCDANRVGLASAVEAGGSGVCVSCPRVVINRHHQEQSYRNRGEPWE
jgi:hypothetical protein